MKQIKTRRLLLRPFAEADYDDLYEFMAQLAEDEFEGYPGINYENGKEQLRCRVSNDAYYAIVLCDTGKVIGNIYDDRYFAAKEVG